MCTEARSVCCKTSSRMRSPRSTVLLPELWPTYLEAGKGKKPACIPTELLVKILRKKYDKTTHKVCHNLDVSGLAIYKAYYSHESHCPELSVSGRSLAYLKIMVRSEVKTMETVAFSCSTIAPSAWTNKHWNIQNFIKIKNHKIMTLWQEWHITFLQKINITNI